MTGRRVSNDITRIGNYLDIIILDNSYMIENR